MVQFRTVCTLAAGRPLHIISGWAIPQIHVHPWAVFPCLLPPWETHTSHASLSLLSHLLSLLLILSAGFSFQRPRLDAQGSSRKTPSLPFTSVGQICGSFRSQYFSHSQHRLSPQLPPPGPGYSRWLPTGLCASPPSPAVSSQISVKNKPD